MILKPYPKDNEPRSMDLSPELHDQLQAKIAHGTWDQTNYCSPPATEPRSPATPSRTRVWAPE
jgi:hypothetical protein